MLIEDLVSIGTIGLIKAVNTFDPSKKIKLATYASRCIENEILMYLRRNNKTRAEVSFDEPLNTDWDGNELLLSDVLGVESDVIKLHRGRGRPCPAPRGARAPYLDGRNASWSCALAWRTGRRRLKKR